MYPPKKPLLPETPVFIEVPGKIIGVDPDNSYWYNVQTADGAQMHVEIMHLSLQSNEVHGVRGADDSLSLRSTRYSLAGVVELYHMTQSILTDAGRLPDDYIDLRQRLAEAEAALEQLRKQQEHG